MLPASQNPTPIPEPREGAGSRIRRLGTLLVNQIAAGEVVERPASVVKELLENALDAGAGRVRVEIEAGGIELVRVVDDGHGIGAGELALAVAPHATSKIAAAGDLDRIATFGFRGEALASIASVSRVTIRSRERGDEGGAAWEIEVEGDRVSDARPASGAAGTSVSVRNLFFNTPARRKFLRTAGTERTRCMDVVRASAMSHSGVAFEAVVDGKAVLDVPAGQGPRDRALAILGKELAAEVMEVLADGFEDARGLSLWGLVGKPTIARATARAQHFFINGRAIKDRTIQHALGEAFRGLAEPGRYPTAVLMLEMSPEGVDVNVHPQKTEVRFRDQSMVHSVVLRAVREALAREDLTPSFAPGRGGFGGSAGGEALPAGAAQGAAGGLVDFLRHEIPAQTQSRLSYNAIRDAIARVERAGVEGDQPGAPNATEACAPPPPKDGTTTDESDTAETLLPQPLPARRVLQVHNSYLVTQDEQGVLIVDQHALHERVMFELLLERVSRGQLESQQLLTPAVIEASAERVERLSELGPLLTKIGIVVEPLGPRTVGVQAFATFLFERRVDPVVFMGELFDKTDREDFAPDSEEALREVLDMMACKAAVKAGDRMSEDESRALLDLRDEVERSSNCPHGRPTTVRLTISELDRLFGRS